MRSFRYNESFVIKIFLFLGPLVLKPHYGFALRSNPKFVKLDLFLRDIHRERPYLVLENDTHFEALGSLTKILDRPLL